MSEVKLGRALFRRVLLRWTINSIALFIAGSLISGVTHNGSIGAILVTALLLSLINAVVKPVVVILSLPAILLTLGLFTIVVNGLMVYFASVFVAKFEIATFTGAILAGIVVSLVNYALTAYLEERIFSKE